MSSVDFLIIFFIICSSFYRITAYNLSVYFVMKESGSLFFDGAVVANAPPGTNDMGFVNISVNTLGRHMLGARIDPRADGAFVCYWIIPELEIDGFTGGDEWYYYVGPLTNDLFWLNTTTVTTSDSRQAQVQTSGPKGVNWTYPGEWIWSQENISPLSFKTIFSITTNNPTLSPTLHPTKSPTKNPSRTPTISPTRSPTKSPIKSPTRLPTGLPTSLPTRLPTKFPIKSPTKSPTKFPSEPPTKSLTHPTAFPTKYPTNAPIKGEIILRVVVSFNISCDDPCISDLLDKSIRITKAYLTMNKIQLENNANFEKWIHNKSISIGLYNQELEDTVVFYCNQDEYKERIANGTDYQATVRKVEVIETPRNINQTKKNIPVTIIVASTVAAFILICLGLIYYFSYWRPKHIQEATKAHETRIHEIISIDPKKDADKKSGKKVGKKDKKNIMDIYHLKPIDDIETTTTTTTTTTDIIYKIRTPHD